MTDEEVKLAPPPKSRKGLFIALAAGGAVIAAVVIAVVLLTGGAAEQASSSDRIKIEVRANPTAEVRVDGKKIGKTPISLQYPRSSKDVVIEATLVRHWVKRGKRKDERFVGARKITLDRDHLLDFSFANTTLVETKEIGSDADDGSGATRGTDPKPAGSGSAVGSGAKP